MQVNNENDSENARVAKAAKAIASAEFVWGSCQYDCSALQYMELLKEELRCGRDKVLAKYGIKVGPVVILDEDVLKRLKDALCIDVVDAEVVGDDTSEFRASLSGIKSVTDVLYFLRDQAWDLWCGAPYVARFVFPELDLGEIDYEDETGTICWLLKSYGFVEDDEPFQDWDT